MKKIIILLISIFFANQIVHGQEEIDFRQKGLRNKPKVPAKPPTPRPVAPVLPLPQGRTNVVQYSFQGRVIDSETDEAIPGATIVIEGSTGGTLANDEGNFQLNIERPQEQEITLIFNSMGYEAKKLRYSGSTNKIEIRLEPAAPFTVNTVDIVVVSAASKVEQRLADVPNNVNVIPRKQMQTFGWVTLNDVLARQPGFSPSQDYDRRTVSARGVFEGWNNNHYLMLVDGVPFNDNMYGSAFTWEVNPLIYKNSVEVVRGPGSSLYGSNAMFGVISVNTVAPPTERGLVAEGQARIGNLGTQIYDALLKGRGKHLSFVAAANFFNTDGNNYLSYDGSFRTDSAGNLLKFNTQDARRSLYAFGKLQGEGKLSGFSLQYHYQNFKFQTGHGWLWHIPDIPENLRENRQIWVLKYATPNTSKRFKQEYVLRYQEHGVNWLMRYYPNGAFDNYYPNGVTEYLKTNTRDVFGRLQWAFSLPQGGSVLLGTEHTAFFYNGDAAHTANANLDTDYSPTENNQMKDVGPWFAWIKNNPLFTHAIYAQLITPKIIEDRLQVTLGVRYDLQRFEFNAIDIEGSPKEAKSFDKLSPRVGVNFYATKQLIFKLFAARAFRYPSPTELFGSNTFSLASNIRNLKPELLTSFEFATDWQVNQYLKWRNNLFYSNFENLIGYSVANANLSTNIYSLATAGIETELNFQYKNLGGFANYSFAQRVNETILDSTISISANRTTWVPAHVANLGITYTRENLNLALVGRYQGNVYRRDSDNSIELIRYRRPNTNAWTNLDIRAAYTFHFKYIKTVELSLLLTNVLGTKQFLNKNFAFPFDYQLEGRRFLAGLRFIF